MDDLLTTLSGVAVTRHDNTPHNEHPHFALYKAKSTGSSQEERRKHILSSRKEARYDLLTHLRCLEEQGSDTSSEDMECEQVRKIYRRPKRYRNFLMLSEWLVDVPGDFDQTYLAVPCPVGKRTLIVSGQGRTRAYTKSGLSVGQFPSRLPGGCRQHNHRGYAVLDCIWAEKTKTYYVLDLVMWLNQSIMECETEFRLEWLRSRVEEEIPEVSQISKYNPNRFVRVPYYPCTRSALTQMLADPLPFPEALDGVLFYHRGSHYTHGPTPLVGWLKAYMFPEILGIHEVPEALMAERPLKYVNLSQHVQYAKDKKDRKDRGNAKMDTSGPPDLDARQDTKKNNTKGETQSDCNDGMDAS